MHHFKFKQFFLITIIGAALVSCTKPHREADDGINGPGRDDKASANATFKVGKGSGGDGRLEQISANTKWQVPLEANFSYTACIEDRSSHKEAVGHSFEAEDTETGLRYKTDDKSNEAGCISWQQTTPFNFLARQSAQILKTWKIIGTGVHTGTYTVSYLIDPWAIGPHARDKVKPVEWRNDISLQKDVITDKYVAAQALAGTLGGTTSLLIKHVSGRTSKIKDKPGERLFNVTLSGKPTVQLFDLHGAPVPYELDTGAFVVYGQFFYYNGGSEQKDKVLAHDRAMNGMALVRDGELIANFQLPFKTRMNANLAVHFKFVPEGYGSTRELSVYEGTYDLGEQSDLFGKWEGDLRYECLANPKNCTMETARAGARTAEELNEHLTQEQIDNGREAMEYVHDGSAYGFENLKLRFVSVSVDRPETATQRTVLYSVSTCITDKDSGRRVQNEPFIIEYLDENGDVISDEPAIPKMTGDDGCLRWPHNVWHKYYKPEDFIKRKVRISHGRGVTSTGERTAGSVLSYFLNPWDDKFTFGYDSHEFPYGNKKLQKIASRFFVGGFGYHTIRFLYSFDRFMQLEVKKTVLLEIDPRVLRYSSITNARRATEALRDGIYLMKVAIQKNFLDPASRGLKIVPDDNEKNRSRGGSKLIPGSKKPEERDAYNAVPKREYITTKTSLVRVVDGRVILPIELTMRDLRLMRIRSNFLVEFQPVEERLLIGNEAVQNEMDRRMMENKRAIYTEMRDKLSLPMSDPDYKAALTNYRKKIEEKSTATRRDLNQYWDKITQVIHEGESKGISLKGFDVPTGVYDDFQKAMERHDFTDLNLPKCDRQNCDRFIEADAGLERRTFVGPVIFLSNGYSDAMRATDNLDESCSRKDYLFLSEQQKKAIDDPDRILNMKIFNLDHSDEKSEEDWYIDSEAEQEGKRQNMAYRKSAYYGSLSHLCYSSVDDLITQEEKQEVQYQEEMTKLSSIDSFAENFNVDFGLLNEANVKSVSSTKKTLTSNQIVDRLNGKFESSSASMLQPKRKWLPQDLEALFFGSDLHTLTDRQVDGICSLLVAGALDRVNRIDPSNTLIPGLNPEETNPDQSKDAFNGTFFGAGYNRCVAKARSKRASLIMDERYRVLETGPDYVFNGGLQVNLNVGESFSVSRSGSYGGSTEFIDFLPLAVGGFGFAVQGPMGAFIGTAVGGTISKILKPLSVKNSSSLSNSDGTSVSQSTYLVAQIAKFNVQLTKYEHCRVFHLDADTSESLFYELQKSTFWFNPNFSKSEGAIRDALNRGIFVCDGKPVNESIKVPEDYFYFTQHFTEGDMLDQADLLNAPWLLSLRGDRDFGTFLNAIEAHEGISLSRYNWKSLLSWAGVDATPKPRRVGWPLEQMAETYRNTLPSFPGFYTILPKDDQLTTFPIDNRHIEISDNPENDSNKSELVCSKECAQGLPPPNSNPGSSLAPVPHGQHYP